ncbi:MAG: nitroreductase [Paramuribaculum sp.]|nr:nitroreductase [Paramuribaculum sp.]
MIFPDNTLLLRAIDSRHSVRAYLDCKPQKEILDCLSAEITRINTTHDLSFRLVADEPTAFSGFLARYGKFRNVTHYIIVSGPKGDYMSRLCGYEGERLVLAIQALGLNSCWVGMSFRKSTVDFNVPASHKIRAVIAFGYGESRGVSHKIKTPEQVSNITDGAPQWFLDGIDAALKAPTAINQQKFHFTLTPSGNVTVRAGFSLVGYTHIDLGIAACHFDLAAAPGHTTVLN